MLRERPWYADGNAQRLTSLAFVLIALIAAFDSVFLPNVGLSLLYLIPLCIAATFLSTWQIIVLSVICAAFTEAFSTLLLPLIQIIARVALSFSVNVFVASMIRKMAVISRAACRRMNELEEEVSLRHGAQEQLELLINSSSAGIVTVSPDGKIAVSNKSAHQLFGVAPGGLSGQPIGTFLPLLQVLDLDSRTTVTCEAIRANGTRFSAVVALSKFASTTGSETALVVLERSEVLQESEKSGLR